MNKERLIQEAMRIIYEVPNNPNLYMVGILLHDFDVKNHIKKLAHLQAIIMQSLQVNNQKRALKYIVAFNIIAKNNAMLEGRLNEAITDKLLVSASKVLSRLS